MTIRELLALPEMDNIRCVAAENFLDNPISGCGVMEFGESIRWVKKGEFVLTSGRIFEKDEMLQRRLIVELKECGCAALGVKIKGFLKAVPEAMIEEAKRQQLPLLAIPFYHSFSEISELVYRLSFKQSLSDGQRNQLLLEKLGKLFFSHQGLESMLRQLCMETDHTFLVTDIQYNIISLYSSDEYQEVFKRGRETKMEPVWTGSFFTEGGKKERPAYRYCNFKIEGVPYRFFVQALPDYSGCLCLPVEQGELDPRLLQIAAESGVIIALELARGEQIRKGISGDSFLDFLRDDGEKGEAEIIRLCGSLGFSYQYKRVCIVFQIEEMNTVFLREKMKEAFRQILKREYGENLRPYLCAGMGIMAAFLIFKDEVGERQAEQTAYKIGTAFIKNTEDFEIYGGVSRCCKKVGEIRRSFAECMEALDLKQWERGGRKIFKYQDGAVYHALYNLSRKELAGMYQDRAKILVDYDKKNGTKLAESVKVYYDSYFNVVSAAKKLYIHRNTMRQRLEKAEELLQSQLEDWGYSLYLGLCAWEIMGKGELQKETGHDD